MKTQVRKNILTNLWEVQAKESIKDKWQKVAECASREEAEKRANSLANSKSGKLPKPKKKTSQKGSKTAKGAKSK